MSAENLYAGINPHLNSALQQRGGGWKSFHTAHLMHIFEVLDSNLPDHYYAVPESSLQESLLEEDELNGLVIYRVEQDGSTGKPVTRIELLSPANKPAGSHYGTYMFKRNQTLNIGLRLVEVDYLHERRPLVDSIPSYAENAENAYPYHIIVSDPRPTIIEGTMDVYGIGMLDKLPQINIPLDNDDLIQVDFSALYNQTFSKRPFYRRVDYTHEPINMMTYTPQDQSRIRDMMQDLAEQMGS